MHKLADVILNVMLPIAIGGTAYFLPLTGIVRNFLPDGLWAYALISGILIIWNRKPHIGWISMAFAFFCLFEMLQSVRLLKGTADFVDILIYITFGSAALFLNIGFINILYKSTQTGHHEKSN